MCDAEAELDGHGHDPLRTRWQLPSIVRVQGTLIDAKVGLVWIRSNGAAQYFVGLCLDGVVGLCLDGVVCRFGQLLIGKCATKTSLLFGLHG